MFIYFDMSNEVNYMQIVKQTHDEEMAMYMRCTKKELCVMLIQCNRLLGDVMSYENTITHDFEITPQPAPSITFNGFEYILKT
jgi:hypothetical protein